MKTASVPIQYQKLKASTGKRIRMKAFDWFNYILLGIFALITLYPFLFVLAGSFNDGQDFQGGGVWIIPRMWTTANYQVIMSDSKLWFAFRNTILKTVLGTVTALLFTSLVAYAMSRKELKFRNGFQWLNLFTMFFGGGLIPYFVLINALGLYDSFLVYIIPSLYSVYNMIVISSFFGGISNDLHESAVIDGAGELRIWWQIYMPLSKAVLATVTLWIAVSHWNGYFNTMIYSRGGENMVTLQYYLMGVINRASYTVGDNVPGDVIDQVTPKTVSYAAIFIATIPILCVYPLLQKQFASGVMIGSLKG